jgi:Fic family protein
MGTRQGLENMPEGLSMYAEKVYNAMKNAGLDSEEKMANAERIVGLTKAPKNFVLRALDELQSKGLAKRRAREKAAGYYLIIKP